MLNSIQMELLDSFIGEEGIYFTTIRDDEAINLGTKILYLERAISQNCHNFLLSLDKLYNSELDEPEKTANIEQKTCAIQFLLGAGQASEIKNTIYLIILFCYDSFHSGTESLVTSAGRGAKVRHIDQYIIYHCAMAMAHN